MEAYNAIQLAAYTSGIGVQAVVGAAVASAVLCVELPRRFGTASTDYITPRTLSKSCAKVAGRCLPEMMGLIFVLGAGVVLRMFGPNQPIANPVEQQVWDQILHEWPVLHGGDTLLGFQTMLRLLVLLAITMRMRGNVSVSCAAGEESATRTPLSGMTGVLALAAMLTRVSMCTQDNAYWLDGPLGQSTPIVCEIMMVPLLAAIALSYAKKAPITAVAAVSAATAWASQHYLNLALNPSIDRLFTLAHTLEILSAFAFLYSTIRAFLEPQSSRNFSATTGFVYIMMPLQQCLAVYYFLTALEPGPETVGAGRPWCLLILGNLLSFGVYLFAAAIWLASYWVNGQGGTSDSNGNDDMSINMSTIPQQSIVSPLPLSGAAFKDVPLLHTDRGLQCAQQVADHDEVKPQLAEAIHI